MKRTKSMLESAESNEGVRINKYLADAGVCSRREGDKAIESGKVTIDGEPALIGSRVLPGQKVIYCGKEVKKERELVLIAFNKPVGIVCTTDRRDPDNIIDFISYEKRIYPIGRLDKDSEGLILLTNDGDIVNKILRAGNQHEKEYIVTVNKQLTPEFLSSMAGGVPILDTVTRPCRIEQLGKNTFSIILTQGLNRQIRRMCEALDYRTTSLKRVRIMNVSLGRLKTGTFRNLTDYELEGINELIKNSSNAPRRAEGEIKGSVTVKKEFMDRKAKKPTPVTDKSSDKQTAGKPWSKSAADKPSGKPAAGKPWSKSATDKPSGRPAAGKPWEKSATDKPSSRPTAGKPWSKPATDKPSGRQPAGKPWSKQPADKPAGRQAMKRTTNK